MAIITTFGSELITLAGLFVSFRAAVAITGILSRLGTTLTTLRGGFTTLTTNITATVTRFNALPTAGLRAQFALVKLGQAFRALNVGARIARLGVVTFQASLTFGLSLVLTEVLSFVLQTKDELGGWGNFLQTIALRGKIAFLQLTETVLNAVNTIVSRLSVLQNLPFGLGDKFTAFGDKVTETNIVVGESIRQTQQELANLSNQVTESAEVVATANNVIKASNDQVTTSAKDAAKAQSDLINLKSQLGGVENELAVIQAQEEQRLQILQTAKDQELIQEQEFQELRRQVLQDSLDQEQAARDNAVLNAQASTQNFSSNFIAALRANARASRVTFGEIARTANSVLARGIGNSFQAVGRAIANGQNAFDAFKGALKNVLGEIASATGDLFIKQGIGYLFFNPAIGAGLITAGAGLKILSGVLGGGGAGAPVAGGGFGGGASLDLAQDPTIAQADIERQEPQVVFQTVVQGDILDSSDTRRRLFNLFQEGAEEEGIELNQGVFA